MRSRAIKRVQPGCILLLLLTSFFTSATASDTIDLKENAWRHDIFREGMIFPDPAKSLDYQQILALTASNALGDGGLLSPDGQRYWTRATVRNAHTPQDFYLRVNTTLLSDVHFYVIKNGRLIAESHQGAIPWSYAPATDLAPSFNLPVHFEQDDTLTFVISYESKRFNRKITTELLPAKQAIYENNARIIFIIFILGMLIVLALYNAIIGIAMKRLAYLWYALHATFYVILFLFIFGYAARFFSITDINFQYYQLASNGALIAGLMFIYHFFELKSLAPRIALLYRGYVAIIAVQLILAIGFDSYTPYKLLAMQQLLHGPLILLTAIVALRRGLTAAWFVMTGWLFISLAIVWGILTQFGLLPTLSIVREMILASVGLDMMLLSLAMAYQFRRLEKEQMTLRKKEEIQDRFLATLSHEVRTPLSSIITLVSSVIDRLGKQAERKTLEEVKYSGDALLSMVDNLLLFTQSKRNVVHAQQHPFEPRILLKSVVTLFTERAQCNRVTVTAQTSPQVPERLLGDEVLLRQIIINLLGNAIKYTRDGRVAITVKPSSIEADHCELAITISDSGKGIPESEQKRIFEQFYQIEKNSAQGSAGMGLYIVSELVKVLDGRLQLHSAVGEGTTITLNVPFGIAAAEEERVIDNKLTGSLTGTTLLLVEDDPTLCQLIDRALSPLGMRIVTAGTAHDALQRIDERLADFVLTDLHLPDESGIDLVRHLSESIRTSDQQIPLLIMTASTDPALHAELADMAIAETLIKPITASVLIATLAAHGGGTIPAQTSHSAEVLDLALIDAHRSALGSSAFTTIISHYVVSMQGYLEELAVAINEGNMTQLDYLAHKIAGLSASLGLREVSALAEQMEEEALSEQTLGALLDQLVQANSRAILLIDTIAAPTAEEAEPSSA